RTAIVFLQFRVQGFEGATRIVGWPTTIFALNGRTVDDQGTTVRSREATWQIVFYIWCDTVKPWPTAR
ncbi:hypothetical protein, partial [Polymorphospora sp. NPDC050346]|uniref:hypothetical protein n=1 Tax=Polymorphospora sp. NPDC050346 TaxID=3155780 RepID=UPI0033E5D8BC